MSDDITKKLRFTMPDFKGIEISCPCRIRSSLMKEAADVIEKLTRERDEARADVDRLRGDRDTLLLDERDFVRKHRAEIERLTRERDEARDAVARQRARRKLRLLEAKP